MLAAHEVVATPFDGSRHPVGQIPAVRGLLPCFNFNFSFSFGFGRQEAKVIDEHVQ
jgi:hypothetical protein